MSELKTWSQWREWVQLHIAKLETTDTYEMRSAIMDYMARAIEEEVEKLRAGPKVKPLEWSPGHSAKSPCGAYYIIPVDGRFAVSLNAMTIGAEDIGRFATIEAAKAAAQADYEARVLSALVQP